jgi:ABC-type lipoprotein release transport system permease subunit
VQIFGIDTTAALYDPIRAALVAGTFLEPDDRSGILIGQRLAESLGLQIGRKINLTIVTADGQADQGSFTIRGLFATGIPSYDESAALLPLAKAQAFTHANGRASAVVVLLKQQANTAEVAAALHEPGTNTLTWQMLNQAFIASIQLGESFYVLLDLIVILIVAVIIANTLLMSVFERIREIGILSALGMKGRQIIQMLLLEAAGLGVAGIILGLGIGLAGVTYLAMVGIPLASSAASVGTNVALSSVMHARFAFDIFAQLAAATLLITLVAALYPAWYAARLEPVVALHS